MMKTQGHNPTVGEECHGEELNTIQCATVKSLIQYTMPGGELNTDNMHGAQMIRQRINYLLPV